MTLASGGGGNGDLFVLSWARVRRVSRGSISSELIMSGGGVRSILLLPLVAKCLKTIDICIRRMFVNRVQVVLSGFSMKLFCFVQAKTLYRYGCRYGCMYSLSALGCVIYICCVGFVSLDELNDCAWNVGLCMFIVSKALLISSATVIVQEGICVLGA